MTRATTSDTRREVLAAALVAVVLSMVYLWRLLPGVGFAGDTMKFQFVGPTAGTVHETGYPVYLMLIWLTSHVPIGDVASRVNATSSLFAVAACVLMYFVQRRMDVRISVAVAFTIGFGLIPVVLLYAVVAEVYTVHLALMMAMLLVLLMWQERRSDWLLFLLMGLVAISFGNHMTTVLFVPGILGFLWHVDRERAFTIKMSLGAVTAAVAAMLLYVYVIWRASDASTLYLEIAPESLRDLVDMWLGGRFRGRVLALPIEAIVVDRLPFVALMISLSFLVLLPLIIIGFRMLRGSAVVVLLLWWVGATFIFAITYDIADIHPYLIPLLGVLAILSAVGAEGIADRWVRSRPIRVTLLVLIVLVMSVPLLSLQATDWSEAKANRTDVEAWLTDLPANSVLAAPYREAMAAWNLMSIGGIETDVEVLLVEEPTLDGDHPAVLDNYMRGNPEYSHRLRVVIDPGKTAYAPADEWMCYLVEEGFKLVPVRLRLYLVDSVRYEMPLEDRWTKEMQDICIEIDPYYADL